MHMHNRILVISSLRVDKREQISLVYEDDTHLHYQPRPTPTGLRQKAKTNDSIIDRAAAEYDFILFLLGTVAI